ncbi:hypothetical protein, partial [Bradyrhizobium sp.]|uniref:hypothetical protein n=1 Tax=Bradyrhizobium sp. TaxID=376 RepID=UPI003C29D398
LELITLVGFIFSFLSFFAALFYFAYYILVIRKPPQGFTTVVILVLLSTSFQTTFIGMLGEYIGRIFRNTRSLPSPIIDQRIEPIQTHDDATLVPDAATSI